jgi:HSP90 family molecular chaperone
VKVNITLDAKAKTITVSDSGIGMTLKRSKYINQIAFSGATNLLEKLKKPGMPMSLIVVLAWVLLFFHVLTK